MRWGSSDYMAVEVALPVCKPDVINLFLTQWRSIKTSFLEGNENTWESTSVTCTASESGNSLIYDDIIILTNGMTDSKFTFEVS